MSYGLQLLGNARSVRGDQFRRPEFDRQGRGSVRMVGKPEVIAQVLVNALTGEVTSWYGTCPVSRLIGT